MTDPGDADRFDDDVDAIARHIEEHDPPPTDPEVAWARATLQGHDTAWPGNELVWGHGRKIGALAAALGFEAVEHQPGFPWIIAGTIDGHPFRWRERGEEWALTIDGNLAEQGLHTIPAADEPVATVRLVERLVRTHLLRAGCPHTQSLNDGDPYCRRCGTALS